MNRARVAVLLSETVTELKAKACKERTDMPLKRIILAGGICNHSDIYPMIEDAGGAIVWDDFCTGARNFSEIINDGTNPISRIAERLINRIVCPAKHIDLDGRASYSHGKGKKSKGHIFIVARERGIPSIMIEADMVDERSFSESQTETRIDAFIEMIRVNKNAQRHI